MSKPASSAAWVAAGVRHELLMRVLPALRHDMAGPLSVARMGNSVLKRYLVAQPFDPEQSRKRLEQTEEQLNQLLLAIRALNRWDLDSIERVEAAPLAEAAVELARPMLDLHGVSLDAVMPDLGTAGWPSMAPARGLYAVIGALSYLQDTASGPIQVALIRRDGGLLLQADAGSASAFGDDHRPAARRLQIDAQLLGCLAQDLNWPMKIEAGSVLMHEPAQD